MPTRRGFPTLFVGLAYVACFVLLEVLSLKGLYRGIGVTPWSPSAGLALAVAYLGGREMWPYLFAAPAIGILVVHPLTLGIAEVVVIVATSVGVLLAAAEVLRRFPGFDPTLRSVRSILILFAVAAGAASLQTVIYIGALSLSGLLTRDAWHAPAWRFFVGDLVGVLVVTPLLLLWRTMQPWPRPDEVHLAQLGVLVAALLVIFGYPGPSTYYQLFYLLFLPILWVAVRDGVLGATIVLNACQLGVIIGANARLNLTPGLSALQTLMIVLVMTGLLLGAVVTERQIAGQRLRDQQAGINRALRLRSAGETAAAIAHQINQPLTAITTFAGIATDALAGGKIELAKTTIGKLQSECDRAATVLRSIRDLVKQGGLTRTPFALQPLFVEVAQLLAAECAANRIVLDTAAAPGIGRIEADRVQLQQALYNLVNNSIEAIRDAGRSGRIELTARRSDNDEIVIEVSDDGPGFAPGLDTIAGTPFTTTKNNGSGLGLAIARSVVEAHGGSLAIVPRNTGATVRLTLPAGGGYHG